MPRIEVTTIFSGSVPAENRFQEWEHFGCNQTYYDVNYDSNSLDECKELLNTVSIYVFNGAARK